MKSVGEIKKTFDYIFDEVGRVIVGQEEMLKQIVIAMFCNSNAVIEGYPGLAKTLSVSTIAKMMDLDFARIQNTPDLMPSDITGTYILDEQHGKRVFKFQPGPIFANVILADEINRATPKTQSALLEAMQEKQVTVGSTTYELDKPFFVLATQNPIEQEGTYPIPEAQADRFLLKIKSSYPTYEQEVEIVNRYTEAHSVQQPRKIISKQALLKLQELTRQVPVSTEIKQYAVKLVQSTRAKKDLIEYGASPRASIGLILASKAKALIDGRKYVSKEDINEMAYPILRHRIILSFEAERQNLKEDDVIKSMLK